jgi:carbon storage regulator
LVIDDTTEVFVTGVRGDSVQLGIVAPKTIPVHRRETFDRIEADRNRSELQEERSKRSKKNKHRIPPAEYERLRLAGQNNESYNRKSQRTKFPHDQGSKSPSSVREIENSQDEL